MRKVESPCVSALSSKRNSMTTEKRTGTIQGLRKICWNLVLISIGSVLCALSINGILIPKGFYGAGFTGIALLVHYMVPAVPVALVYFVINIPVFGIGWIYVGRRFFLLQYRGHAYFHGGRGMDSLSNPYRQPDFRRPLCRHTHGHRHLVHPELF